MMFQRRVAKAFLSVTLLVCGGCLAEDRNEDRSLRQAYDQHRILESDVECLFLQKDISYERNALVHGPTHEVNCELLPSSPAAGGRFGRTYRLIGTEHLPPDLADQELESGVDTLAIPRALISPRNHTIEIPRDANVVRRKGRNRPDNQDNFFDYSTEDRRKLAQIGDRTILVVRVTTPNSSPTVTSAQLSDKIFGTNNDPHNLASQYEACSFGKLKFLPFSASIRSVSYTSPGVIQVEIPTPSEYNYASFEKDRFLVSEASEYLNDLFGNAFPFDYAMFCLPPDTFSGIAYAWRNGQRSVYKDVWATSLSSQLHEVGHNLGLGHAGSKLSSENEFDEYGDSSGALGYSFQDDDGPRLCFSAPKSFQLGWYADKTTVLDPMTTSVWSGRLVGVANYDMAGNGDTVILKLETGTPKDYYINFNRQTGVNSGTMEGGDQVLVTEQGGNGESYEVSTKIAELEQGKSHVINNYGGSDITVRITANVINTVAAPGFAEVTVSSNTDATDSPSSSPTDSPTPSPTSSPTGRPSTSPSESPTNKPSTSPSQLPSTSPSSSAAPSSEPTTKPSMSSAPSNAPSVSAKPSAEPSLSPTKFPSERPSTDPSSSPTVSPSSEPSVSQVPSSSPTNAPSEEPSEQPSLLPSSLPSAVPIGWNTITYDDFERDNVTNPTGWGSFNNTQQEGVRRDAARVSGADFKAFIPEGRAAVRIRDNSGIYSSIFQYSDHDVSVYENLRVVFSFIPHKIEDGEGFLLEYSSNSGINWSLVQEWIIQNNTNAQYQNDVMYRGESVDFNQDAHQSYLRTSSARIRFRCNATGNADPFFLDEILFEGYGPMKSSP